MGHKVTVSCTECLHFVALQMTLYLHSVGYTLDVSFYHPAHPFTACFKTLFFFLHRVTNFISLHQDTTTTLFKIKKISYLVFVMYKWSQTSKKKTNQICTVESLYIVGNKPRFLSRFMPHLIQNQSHKVPVVSACISVLS